MRIKHLFFCGGINTTEFELVHDENGTMHAVKRQQLKIVFQSDDALLEAVELISQRVPESEKWDTMLINIENVEWFNKELEMMSGD